MSTNNPPEVIVEFTREQAEFLIVNCDSNIVQGLEFLQQMESKDLIERMVGIIEDFKGVRAAVKKGLGQ